MKRDNRRRYHSEEMKNKTQFISLLSAIEKTDEAGAYELRNRLIFAALSFALSMNMPAGVRNDPQEPEWPVVFIELPTGQISWHVPAHAILWDNHTTEEKYARIHAYADQILRRTS